MPFPVRIRGPIITLRDFIANVVKLVYTADLSPADLIMGVRVSPFALYYILTDQNSLNNGIYGNQMYYQELE